MDMSAIVSKLQAARLEHRDDVCTRVVVKFGTREASEMLDAETPPKTNLIRGNGDLTILLIL